MRVEVEISRVGLEGQGVGYDEGGNIYFVPGALPGDRVSVEVAEHAKKYRDAELAELLRPSPERKASPCSYFPRCGGCDWLHWNYEAQLAGKDAILKHVLERGGLEPRAFRPMVPAVHPLGYRNRVQLRQEGKKLGFLRKRTREIVDVERCAVAHPKLNLELERIRSEATPTASRKKIELALRSEGTVEHFVDRPHAYSGFRQINSQQNEVLRKKIVDAIGRFGARQVLELFAGDGNLTFSYLPLVERVIAVDANEAACAAGRAAKPEGEKDKLIFLQSTVDRRLLRKLPEDFRASYDVLVLDPPRTGAGMELSELVHPGLNGIVYVSCNPVTFTRDVARLKRDFVLEEIQGVDMFPNTRHIEFVARFARS